MSPNTWRAVIHGVAKSQTRLSDWTELNNNLSKCKSFISFQGHIFFLSIKSFRPFECEQTWWNAFSLKRMRLFLVPN